MKTTLLLALFLGLTNFLHAQQDDTVVETIDKKLQEKTKFLNPQYLISKPETETNKKLPLLIYLHGAGGVGNDIHRIKGQTTALLRGIEKFGKGPCFLVAPQSLEKSRDGGGWIPEELDVLLQHLKATHRIDETRIYLTGNSMGGYGTWVWGAHNPEHFAAIAPVSGGTGPGGPKDVTPKLAEWAKSLTKVPVYAFTGAKDRVVPSERSESMVAAIKKAGGKQAKLTVYPEQGHNARSVAFASKEFYDWMFSKSRK